MRALLTVFIVDTLTDDPVADSTATDGYVSLREAILAANANTPFGDAPAGGGGSISDTVTFAPSLAGDLVLDGLELTISEDLTLTGPGVSTLTISGNGASRVLKVDADTNVEIAGLAITHGSADYGGGILNEGALSLSHVVLSQNHASEVGGGIWNSGQLIITASVFSDNSTQGNGGGIANRAGGTLTVFGSVFEENRSESTGGGIDSSGDGMLKISNGTFTGNEASNGGAIYSFDSVFVNSTTFAGNSAEAFGGAVSSLFGTLSIDGSTVTNNSARFGGGIDTFGSVIDIANSTISGNTSSREGGAIENLFGTVRISNTTISGNETNGEGGAIWNYGNLEISNGTLVANRADADGNGSGGGGGLYDLWGTVLSNTIVAANRVGAAGNDITDDIFGTVDNSSANNLVGDAGTAGGLSDGANDNIVGNAGIGTIDITTVLDTALADNGGPTLTHALVVGSPAIDAGENSKAVDADGNPLPYDQRGEGFNRIVNGVVDIGAFEVPPPPQPVGIDAKPGSEPNSINLASQGLVAVAILTTDDFDAANINVSTVVWAGANVAQKNNGSYFSALEDVDGDGDLDLVVHFLLVETHLLGTYEDLLRQDLADGTLDSYRQSVDIALEALTDDGGVFRGYDSVDLFLTGKNLRDFRTQRGI